MAGPRSNKGVKLKLEGQKFHQTHLQSWIVIKAGSDGKELFLRPLHPLKTLRSHSTERRSVGREACPVVVSCLALQP